MKRLILVLLSLVLVFSLLLISCGKTEEEPPAPPEPEKEVEEVKKPTTRKGGWLDEIVVSVIEQTAVLAQLEADAIDIYTNGFGTNGLDELNKSGFDYTTSNGTYYTIQFNPAKFKTGYNPFSNRKIREAFNYLIDRNYINQEYYAGGALAKWFPIMTNFGDYADLVDVARRLEAEYAYDFDKAAEIIRGELANEGYELKDGKFVKGGKPLEVTFLIRNDGDGTRKL
ncbi:MAG: hypothetical protein GX928_02650, partial [Ruminococcaceae bacterium]|nr:hypothetical protein [Oscillospiraceae bacterium]